MASYSYTYPSTTEAEGFMHDDLFRTLERHSIPEDIAKRFGLAVSEAFTNALIHGNRRNPGKLIKVTLCINGSCLSADIIDEGTNGLGQIKKRRTVGLMSETGRGIDLMNHYAQTDFVETETGGLKVTITFSLEKVRTQ